MQAGMKVSNKEYIGDLKTFTLEMKRIKLLYLVEEMFQKILINIICWICVKFQKLVTKKSAYFIN